MSGKGLLPDAGLPRNPGSVARMESGQQPGVLEFPPQDPNVYSPLSIPEFLLGLRLLQSEPASQELVLGKKREKRVPFTFPKCASLVAFAPGPS